MEVLDLPKVKTETKLSAKNVHLHFGQKHVLKDCNVAFGKNQIELAERHPGKIRHLSQRYR